MVRHNIDRKQLESVLDVSKVTIHNKLTGKKSFTIDEAKKVLALFPDATFEYLFHKSG
jgi:DNA-binding XRE family transcriptional regulator